MENITLALAALLGLGFAAAKLGQLLRLPSVTGYICAGFLLGPSGLNLVTAETISTKLEHFSQIALMLIALGIGEHLELRRLRKTIRFVWPIGFTEVLFTVFLVGGGVFFIVPHLPLATQSWTTLDYHILAMLLSVVAVATAPAATLHVIRELRATGTMTTNLMHVVAINNCLAITFFGLAISAGHHLIGGIEKSIFATFTVSFSEIFISVLIGILTGLLIDFIVHRLYRREEMLIAGLAFLLFAGEISRHFGLSPLMTGMAVGFTIVNRDRRDVRLFRVLNTFEPPIYVLFFTLAGAHLDTSALAIAGWLGLLYFLLRAVGKVVGAKIGALFSPTTPEVRKYLGLALVPQAGVAIGLIILIRGIPEFSKYSDVITPVVLAGVFLSELIGPASTRFALLKSGEGIEGGQKEPRVHGTPKRAGSSSPYSKVLELIPWSWEMLTVPSQQEGVVLFGASHRQTVAGLARMATLFAHYYKAKPLAIRVEKRLPRISELDEAPRLFKIAKDEVHSLGYELHTQVVRAKNLTAGIMDAVKQHHAHSLVLGYPMEESSQEFQQTIETVASQAPCPVIVIRFTGTLHTERILVPVVSSQNLRDIKNVLCSMAGTGRHKITLLYLLPSESQQKDVAKAETKLQKWAYLEKLTPYVEYRATATDARLSAILEESEQHDILVMGITPPQGIQRFFFGSLANDVAQKCQKPMIMVHNPQK